jgi:hypothetical protein
VTDRRDELLDQVVDELRTLPPVDELAVQRIVRAAGGGRVPSGRVAAGSRRAASWWRARVPLAAAAGLALAAGIGGFLTGDVVASKPGRTSAGSRAFPGESPTLPAALSATAARSGATAMRPLLGPVATQFILDAPRASRVALVGDFNGWDAAATPLVRDPSSGIWTTSVALPPGRHVYAYMVDGARWTLDPRAPAAQDPDFGTPSSVVLVGTP